MATAVAAAAAATTAVQTTRTVKTNGASRSERHAADALAYLYSLGDRVAQVHLLCALQVTHALAPSAVGAEEAFPHATSE